MTSKLADREKYLCQRPRKPVPSVSLGDLRGALGLTIDEVLDRLEEQTGRRYGRGTISAIENGHRGVSADLLTELTVAYGLRPGAISLDYEPRRWAEPTQASSIGTVSL